jgi:hypothetical protein
MARHLAPALRCASLCALLLGAAAAAPPPNPPQNLAPNSQWEVFTGVRSGPRIAPDGRGFVPAVTVSGEETGCNLCEALTPGGTGALQSGGLVRFEGEGLDRALTQAPVRVLSLEPGRGFRFRLSLGQTLGVSRPARAQSVMIGGQASEGVGDAADGWSKTPSLWVWREVAPMDRPPGALYSLGIERRATTPESVVTHPRPALMAGRTLVFGAYVRQAIRTGSGTWRAILEARGPGAATAAARSAAAPAGEGWTWLETTLAIPADPAEVSAGVAFEGAPGDVYYLANPVLAFGEAIGVNNYQKPAGEVLIPVVKLTPATWENAVLQFPSAPLAGGGFGFVFDAYAETGGGIAPTVARLDIALEGIDALPVMVGSGTPRVIAIRSALTAPTLYAPILGQAARDVKAFGGGTVTLDSQGRAVVYSGAAEDRWTNVSMDINGYLLP